MTFSLLVLHLENGMEMEMVLGSVALEKPQSVSALSTVRNASSRVGSAFRSNLAVIRSLEHSSSGRGAARPQYKQMNTFLFSNEFHRKPLKTSW